jgi:hypothetical protein
MLLALLYVQKATFLFTLFVISQIANILWALATAGIGSYAVFESARVDLEKRDVERLNPVDMANIVWAYATVSIASPVYHA